MIAHNVPISRAGWYDYLPQEIGADGYERVRVYRDPAEVFSPAAIASFEGKPVTDDHPPRGVSPTDARLYVKGSTQNVRRGAGDDADLLLADLVIYDETLIREIRDGKREVSAGYECDYVPQDDGTYVQRGIVGNHVAVVHQGRAGERVRIQDQRTRDMDNLEAVKKYGIQETKSGHRTPPPGYPTDREQYADPVNYKYPLNGAHARDAVDYYNEDGEREKGGYTAKEWKIIGRRIVDACNRQDGGGYSLEGDRIVTPDDRKRGKGNDRMPTTKSRPPVKGRGAVTSWLAALGLKHWAQDADPDELVDAVDAMLKESTEDESEEEARAHEREGMEMRATKDDDAERISALEKKIDEMMDIFQSLRDKLGPKTAEDELDEVIEELEDPWEGNQEESHTIDPALISDEEGVVLPPNLRPRSGLSTVDRAAQVVALKVLRQSLSAIPDAATRKKVADKALASLRRSNTYAQIEQAARQRVRDGSAHRSKPLDYSDLGREWAQKRNPHYQNRV